MGGSSSKEAGGNGGGGPEAAASPSYWSIMRQGYDELVNAIIRPPRAEYDIERLGPREFAFCGKQYMRTDLVLVNQRGLALQCSHWEPVERVAEALPCVVFMHGNSSARAVGSFDCAGSGKSEGKYVSLGYWEKDDLRVVVDHLRGSGTVSNIAVWGRSMGAVTALLYQSQDRRLLDNNMTVNAMVLDSPFADFCQLAEELVAKGRERGVVVPTMVTRMALTMLSNSVKSIAGFDIRDLSAITEVPKCTLPALFICAKKDDFIGTHHSQSLHDAYGGPKQIIVADGDHNTLRSSKSLLAIGGFLQRELREQQWCLDQAHYYCNRGNTLEESGKIDAAIRAYRAAITYHSEYPDAHYNLGIALKNRGYVEEAIREYRRTITIKPGHADAHNNLGVALEEKGYVDEAILAYAKAIEHNSQHSEAHCNLADSLQSMGRLDEAVKEYHIAIAQNPGDADTINNLGVALEAKGQLKEAILAYSTAVANKPEHWDAQCNLADALHLRGDLDKAAEVYKFILKYNPTNAQIASSLGNVLHAKGNHAEALAAYEVAVKNNPLDTITHNNMGIVLQTMGEVRRAIAAYQGALRQDPTYAIAHYNLGVALQSQQRLDEAIAAYRTAVKHRPAYADAYNNMGYALQSKGDYGAAIAAYEEAIKLRPDFTSAQANLKHALNKLDGGTAKTIDLIAEAPEHHAKPAQHKAKAHALHKEKQPDKKDKAKGSFFGGMFSASWL
ncbi:palmitoyl-(protein) hydrolase [Aureococcus anophagefferens]|nr:palmitoyl-(protein) hydrolase [Aureococcus anophagefferens]